MNNSKYEDENISDIVNKSIYETKLDQFHKLTQMIYRLNIIDSVVDGHNYLLKQPVLKRDAHIVMHDDESDKLMIEIKDRLDQLETKLPSNIANTLYEARLDRLEQAAYSLIQNNIFEEN